MKIAFDGTVLHGRKSGVGYYCEELLKAMLAIDHGDEFFVFSHKRLNVTFPSANGNLRFSNSVSFPVRAVYLHTMLPRILDHAGPDLCHYTNFLAPISENRPYVVTIHDMGLEVLRQAHPVAKRFYTRPLIPHVARKARLIITNSEYSKFQIIRHLGVPEDRIRITPLAASEEFVPSPGHVPHPYFLYVGNIEPRKNLERLIEAFARLPIKDHQLVIAGNRWYRGAQVEQKARSLGLAGRVKFLGYVPRSDLPALFSGATAFLYPSLLEGFGLPVVEAMACGTPVITSNSSALKEIAGEAALLVDPKSVREITEAMTEIAEDQRLRRDLSRKGLRRAAKFSWRNTAELTLEAYREAIGEFPSWNRRGGCAIQKMPPKATDAGASTPPFQGGESRSEKIATAIQKTIDYARLFQYPLAPEELRERLFDVEVDEATFRRVLKRIPLAPDADLVVLRASREQLTDQAIRGAQPELRTLVSTPFVRMAAFSGSTAHRNMSNAEDLDLFMIVEDGKLWAVFLIAVVWAKLKGLRKRLCMNYLISDAALPLFEHDAFTAQQVASLKPFYGKTVYDRFIEMNPFVRRSFPNFEPSRHRERYPELQPKFYKGKLETLLRFGPIQVLERISRILFGTYLRRKTREAATEGETDVQLDRRRLKLHLRTHKGNVLSHLAGSPPLAPAAKDCQEENVEV